MRKKEKPDRACIRNFASFLEAIGLPVSGVDCWPEDETQGEIDAIIGHYAVQHTSLDALPYGRLADGRFKQVIGDLEEELEGKLGFPLIITWDWAAIQKGQNWRGTSGALRDWILKNARNLSDGKHRITDAPGVPFAFDVRKGGPIKIDGVRFARYASNDLTFGERLHDQLAGRHKKLATLGAHQDQGRTTVLLLESRDLALMSPVMIVDALEAAFPTRPAEIDEIWFLHYVAPDTVNVHNLRSGGIWLYDLVAGMITLHNPDGPQLSWAFQ